MKKLFGLLLFMVALGGCVDEYGGGGDDIRWNGESRTLFIYMAAESNLASYAVENLADMRKGIKPGMLENNRILVYYDPPQGPTKMLELIYDPKMKEARYDELKDYGDQAAVVAASYAGAIADMVAMAPAEKYGLVLWGHASGWLPSRAPGSYITPVRSGASFMSVDKRFREREYPVFEMPNTRSFGISSMNNNILDLGDLAAATPDGLFDFIIADCCLFGQAEVGYEFRNKARYMMASPAEVIANGMPYEVVPAIIFSEGDLLTRISALSKAFYDYYAAHNSYATTAVYDLAQMEGLATAVAAVIAQSPQSIADLNVNGIQVYDRASRHTSFDVAGVVNALLPAGGAARDEFGRQLARTVPFMKTTNMMITLPISPDKYYGMSMYVPLGLYADINDDYFETAWGRRIYSM